MPTLKDRLTQFADEHRFNTKGKLSVALVLTDRAATDGVPIPNLLTDQGGQVRGLGKAHVQKVLARHGIERVLAEEGGRTSRGSIANAQVYADFLASLAEEGLLDVGEVEAFWVKRVQEFFASKPFKMNMDSVRSVAAVVRNLLDQAEARQSEYPGTMILGTVLQHLVGAKLELVSDTSLEHHGASVADAVTNRPGDFALGDVSIHVTTAPGEAVLRKCSENLAAGLRPWIVTVASRVEFTRTLAEDQGVGDRIDVTDIEQFLTCNLMERGQFTSAGRREMAVRLIDRYNDIIDTCETDPGLKIKLS